MKRSVLTVAVMIAVAIAAAPQGSHSSGRESLRGLKQLCVVVEDLGSDIQNDGLDRSAVQTDVEVKLRLAGIQVVTCQEASKTPGGPLLVVNINSMLAKDLGLYAVNVELSFEQTVLLEHLEFRQDAHVETNPDVWRIFATTWIDSGLLTVGKTRVSQAVRDSIRDKVDKFINDYLAVNPRK